MYFIASLFTLFLFNAVFTWKYFIYFFRRREAGETRKKQTSNPSYFQHELPPKKAKQPHSINQPTANVHRSPVSHFKTNGDSYAIVNKVKSANGQPQFTTAQHVEPEERGDNIYINSVNSRNSAIYYNTTTYPYNNSQTLASNSDTELVYSLAQPIDDGFIVVDNDIYEK